jgi:hypothetical protein
MELNKKLKEVLAAIDFTSRYKHISTKHQYTDNSIKLEVDSVLLMLSELGYVFKYIKSESFFKLLVKHAPFQLQFNISLKYGNVELIWDVLENGQRLSLGLGTWSNISSLLLDDGKKVLMPKCRNSDDLREILKEALSIYEDFKVELLKQLS